MKRGWSSNWISSRQPRKQRKYRYNALLHIKSTFHNVHLSHSLREKYKIKSNNLYYLRDKYLDTNNQFVNEASGSKSKSLLLPPGGSIKIPIYVQTPRTPPGNKSLVIQISGALSKTIDLGYGFIQKYKFGEFGTPLNLAYQYQGYGQIVYEDPFELSDAYHHNLWDILVIASKFGDARHSDDTVNEITEYLVSNVYDNLVYSNNILPLYITASDLWIINNRDENGKFQGVCDEYTILFVSLARALNIPARALYFNFGSLTNVQHEAAEIWNGFTWIHVDPTWNVINNPQVYTFTIESVHVICYANDGRYLLESRTRSVPFDEYGMAMLQAVRSAVEHVRRDFAWAPTDPVKGEGQAAGIVQRRRRRKR